MKIPKGFRLWILDDGGTGWRWRCRAANNRILLSSSEGYTRRVDAIENMRAAGMEGGLTSTPAGFLYRLEKVTP